ncbi:MAG: hypothetical protein J7M26_03845 [Armatimonadetes bacterium]|nr:hypothetical protein [Armatimonadota bacterium]
MKHRDSWVMWDWGLTAAASLAAKAVAVVLLALVCAELARGLPKGTILLQAGRVVGLLLLLGGAAYSAGTGWAGGWPAKPTELLAGRIGVAGSLERAREAVPLVRRLLPEVGSGNRIGVMPDGFAVGLLAGAPWRIGDIGSSPTKPGDLHVFRYSGPPGKTPVFSYPLECGFVGVKPVFVAKEGDFLIYRFEALPTGPDGRPGRWPY